MLLTIIKIIQHWCQTDCSWQHKRNDTDRLNGARQTAVGRTNGMILTGWMVPDRLQWAEQMEWYWQAEWCQTNCSGQNKWSDTDRLNGARQTAVGRTNGMILTCWNPSAQRKARLGATLFSMYPTWTELGLNPGFHSKMLPTKCLATAWPSCVLHCLYNLQSVISIAVNIQCGLLGYAIVQSG